MKVHIRSYSQNVSCHPSLMHQSYPKWDYEPKNFHIYNLPLDMLHVCFRKFAHLSGSLSSLFTAPKSRPSKLLATSKVYQLVTILPKLHAWISLPETLFLNPVDIQRGHPLMLERKLILAGSTNWPPLPDKTCSTIAVVTSSGSKTGSLNFGCAVSSWINGVRIQVGLTTLQS
jgi:hypothetical protein